jgi:hypothetical protein
MMASQDIHAETVENPITQRIHVHLFNATTAEDGTKRKGVLSKADVQTFAQIVGKNMMVTGDAETPEA